jgi:hypothetical protein
VDSDEYFVVPVLSNFVEVVDGIVEDLTNSFSDSVMDSRIFVVSLTYLVVVGTAVVGLVP